MRKYHTIALMLLPLGALAQSIEIKDLELPNAPALTLLDGAATNIESPKSIQALTATLINNINNNVSLEINPYMVWSRSKNFYRYNNFAIENGAPVHKPWFHSVYKDLTFSLAKVKTDANQNLSVGLRTNLVRFERSDYVADFIAADNQFTQVYSPLRDGHAMEATEIAVLKHELPTLETILAIPDAELDAFDVEANIDMELGKRGLTRKDYDKIMSKKSGAEKFSDITKRLKGYKTVADQVDTELTEYYRMTAALNESRPKPVFTVDVAAAYSHFFEGDHYSEGRIGKLGGWMTSNVNWLLSSVENANYLSCYLYGRYLIDNTTFEEATESYLHETYFDVGGKVELQFRKFSFAYEYINRTTNKDDYRSVGSLSYKFSDTVSLNGGFGKNFERTYNLVTFLGISWGIESGNDFATKQASD